MTKKYIYHHQIWVNYLSWSSHTNTETVFLWQSSVSCLIIFPPYRENTYPHRGCCQLLFFSWGVLPYRAVSQKTTDDWKALPAIFEKLLGGSPTTQRAAAYLRALANCQLPADEPPALPWHDSGAVVEVMPQPRMEPHPVVLATLCPSVALRAVWRRGRWIING